MLRLGQSGRRMENNNKMKEMDTDDRERREKSEERK